MAVVALKQKPKGPSFGEALAQTAKAAEPKSKKSEPPKSPTNWPMFSGKKFRNNKLNVTNHRKIAWQHRLPRWGGRLTLCVAI